VTPVPTIPPTIPYADIAKASPELQKLYGRLNSPLNIYRMLAHAESAVYGYLKMGNALLFKGTLDPLLREMAILRVGHLCKAPYEVFQHENIARQLAMPEAKIRALKQGAAAPVFDEMERLVLTFTDEVVRDVRASASTAAQLIARLTPRQYAELVLTVGFYQMTCAFLENMGVELEPPGTIDQPMDIKAETARAGGRP
jgi:4-carboxymuconolactone decarboxylase